MAIREDETAADCTGVNPVSTKLLAFALGASFSGFAGSVYAAKLQAITPGAFEFQVSIMLLCMVVLGGAGSLRGVILGGMLITVFDRVVLSQSTFLVRAAGRALGVPLLASADLTLWRWFFFGLGLVLVMLLRPQGLAGRRVSALVVDDPDEPDGAAAPAPPSRVEGIPAWLRERAAPAAAAGLEVQGVTKAFGGVVALNGVDLVVPRGAIVGLIGPNGAGKTTFFNVVTGLARPDAGRVVFEGASLVGLRPNAIVARGIARTFQSIRLFAHMTVLENVLVGEHCRLHARVAGAVLRPPDVVAEEHRARERARALLAFVGLGGAPDDLARNLPYGDQRRLEIARALATEPRLLLLDEPTAGMNPRETEVLTALIDLLRRELSLSILLIEHDMKVVMGISDRVTVLDYGTRIAEGTPAEIQRHPRVIEAYLGTGYEVGR
jgi:branched-chain amino acid transport system permease protein